MRLLIGAICVLFLSSCDSTINLKQWEDAIKRCDEHDGLHNAEGSWLQSPNYRRTNYRCRDGYSGIVETDLDPIRRKRKE